MLAAANPIFGHYDDSKSVGDNIDLMTTILSRFDCIFIVRDVRDVERDKNIARHVLGVHMTASSDTAAAGDIDVPTLKKLIAYCRERCAPRLSDEASALLSDQYVHIRNSVRESLKNNPSDTVVVPITIRQLEALVRLSESLAKMRLAAEATVSDVEEALRLFKVQHTTPRNNTTHLNIGRCQHIAFQLSLIGRIVSVPSFFLAVCLFLTSFPNPFFLHSSTPLLPSLLLSSPLSSPFLPSLLISSPLFSSLLLSYQYV